MIRILVVDDQKAVRDTLAMRLRLEPDLLVVGTAADAAEALLCAQRFMPDVVIMDVRLGGMDGIAATTQLRAALPGCQVVMLTLYDDEQTRVHALAAGAAGFVSKLQAVNTLVDAIRAAAMHG